MTTHQKARQSEVRRMIRDLSNDQIPIVRFADFLIVYRKEASSLVKEIA
jgi:Ca2+-binding EF-hand superfamily protein